MITPILLVGPALAASAGGQVEAHVRLGLSDCDPMPLGCPLLDFRDTVVAGGWVERDLGGARARIAADLRVHTDNDLDLIGDTQQLDQVIGTSVRLRDAWIDTNNLGGAPLDLRLGVQTISWGVADGIHVTDPINPWNLENPLELDAKLAVPAARAALHKGPFGLDLVGVPFFFPTVLPPSGLSLVPADDTLLDDETFEGNTVGNIEARLNPPANTLENASAGARATWAAGFGDIALSAYRGRDSLPQGDGELIITGFQTNSERVDFAVPLVYPKVTQAGLDLRGELFWEIGGWAEAALVRPQETALTASRTQLEALERLGTIEAVPDPLPTVATQDGKTYVRWITGLERSFDRLYLNAQWLHGFATERQADDLSDYGMVFARLTLTDALVLETSALSDTEAWMTRGKLSWLHADAAELMLEGAWITAPDDHTLGAFEGLSHIGVGEKLVF